MASKSIALGLVKIALKGDIPAGVKEDARKADLLLVNDITNSTGDRYAPQWLKFKSYC